MSSHQRLGPDGRHCLHDRWKPPIQLEEEQAIAVRELDPTAHVTLKHNQLTSERGILSLKPADRPKRRNQQSQKEEEQRDHRGRRYVIPSPDQTDEVFGTHRSISASLIGRLGQALSGSRPPASPRRDHLQRLEGQCECERTVRRVATITGSQQSAPGWASTFADRPG